VTAVRLSLRPVPVAWLWAGGTAALVAATLAAVHAQSGRMLLAGLALIAVAALAYLAVWTSPSTIVALAVMATVFSGNDRFGLPIGADRILIALALGSIVLRLPGWRPERRVVLRPLHAVAAMAVAYAVVNAFAAHTLFTQEGFFGLLDKVGIVPILAFVLAPALFGSRRQRDVLLTALVALGAYLGLTAMAEAFNLHTLVWPRYILDPSVGLHVDRVRGPFVEAVAMGLGLYACAVAAAVALATWTRTWPRVVAGIVLLVDIGGTLFTVTRAVWLATAVSTVLAMLVSPTTRRYLTPAVAVGIVALLAAFVVVPGFARQAEQRSNDQNPIYDRLVTDAAAVRAVRAHPLFGVGWGRWLDVNTEYIRQGANYPISPNAGNIEVHNVLLSNAAQLGIIGTVLWLGALLAAVGAALLRPGPAALDPWRVALVALTLHYAIVGAFGPLSYAFPNLLLWLWAGITAMGHTSVAAASPDIDLVAEGA
jgi:putative inorganic carbon (HCO3(-)) transporter